MYGGLYRRSRHPDRRGRTGARAHSLDLRMALGARPRDVTRLVPGGGLRMAVAGVAAGGLAALAATRLLGSMLFGVKPGDPVALATAAAMLLTIAAAAGLLPAMRAAGVEVSEALRHE